MIKTYTISEAAEKLGLSVKTLQRWDREGKLVPNRTPSNRRYYTDEQLNNVKTLDIDVKDMVKILHGRYKLMEKYNLTMGNRNISGHVVYDYWKLQEDDDKFMANFDVMYMEEDNDEEVSTCNIVMNDEVDMVIITVSNEIPEDKRMKWLYSYMKKARANRGIVIAGYRWNMVDFDGKEYSLNFADRVDTKTFKKFLI